MSGGSGYFGGSGYYGLALRVPGGVLSPDRAIVAMVGVVLSRALLRRVASRCRFAPPLTSRHQPCRRCGSGESRKGWALRAAKTSSALLCGWARVLKRARFSSASCVGWLSLLERVRFFKRLLCGWVLVLERVWFFKRQLWWVAEFRGAPAVSGASCGGWLSFVERRCE
jgi:hypothetical protein